MVYKELYQVSGLATNGSHIWYIGVNNEIMQINIKSGAVDCLCIVPEMYDKPYAYRIPVYHKEKLYLLPYYTNRLCIYDLESFQLSFADFPPDIFTDLEEERKLFGYIMTGVELILYGIHPVVIILNLKTQECKAYRADIAEAQRRVIQNNIFWRDGFEYNGNIVVPINYSNCFFKINLKENISELFMLRDQYELYLFQLVKRYGSSIYRVILDKKWNVKVFISDISDLFIQRELCCFHIELNRAGEEGKAPFLCGEIMNGKLYLLPAYQEKVYVIDLDTGNINYFSSIAVNTISKEMIEESSIRNFFCGVLINNHMIAAIHTETAKLIVISEYDNQETIMNLKMGDNAQLKYLKNVLENSLSMSYVIKEDGFFSLNNFVQCLQQRTSKPANVGKGKASLCNYRNLLLLMVNQT